MFRLTDLARRGEALAEQAGYLRRHVLRVVGAPDYAAYLERHRAIHPEVAPMTESEFFRYAIDRKYAKAGPRCC